MSRLLAIRSTAATRLVAQTYAATLSAAFTARTQSIVAALRGDAPWPGPGIIWFRVDGGIAEVAPRAPRGVRLGA